MLESNFVSGIVGALLGAIVSGIISYCLQKQTFNEAAIGSAKEKLEGEQALAMTLVIKLGRILTGFHGLAEHLRECQEKGSSEIPPMAAWQSFIPLANLPEPSRFTSDELSLLLRLKENDLFNLVVNLDVIHNGLLQPMKEAAEIKEKIRMSIDVVAVDGDKVTHEFDHKTFLSIQPLLKQLEALIPAIHKEAVRSRKESEIALNQLVEVANKKLDTSLKTMTLVKMG